MLVDDNGIRLSRAEIARKHAHDAAIALGQALILIGEIVGESHDATATIESARDQARVARAKIDLVIKRIPSGSMKATK